MIVKTNTKTLLRTLKALTPYVSKDETRLHLNGVLLEITESAGAYTCRLVATDGHSMAKAEPLGVTASQPGSGIIPLALCKRIIAACKQDKLPKEADICIDTEEHKLAFTCDGSLITGDLIDSQFPPYRAVIPEPVHRDTDCYVGLSPKYMARAGKSCSDFSPAKDRGFKLWPGGKLEPVRIDYQCNETGDLTIVVMPMRE